MSNNRFPFDLESLKKNLFSPAGWKAAAAGAVGAFVGFLASSAVIGPFFDFSLAARPGFGNLLLGQSLLSMVSGAVLSAAILAYDNQAGLRGRWNRDLQSGIPLFLGLSFLSGGVGQLLYSIMGISRGLPWALMGAGIGMGIGLLRRDKLQASRGALGGAIGGIIGGLLVDGFLAVSYTDAAFATATEIGTVVTGAMIALFMRVVQDTLRTSWLIGTSAGTYQGKEYPLNTDRVTVGKSELNDISLYRETELPQEIGAFVFQSGAWYWQGTTAVINGVPKTQAALQPGDVIQFGTTQFRYLTRDVQPHTITPGTLLPASPTPSPLPATAPGTALPAGPASFNGVPGYQANPAPQNVTPQNATPPYGQAPAYPAAQPSTGVTLPAPTTVLGNGHMAGAHVNWSLRNLSSDGSLLRIPAMNGSIRFGRSPENTLILNEPSVSSNHAEFMLQGSTLLVTDLNSTNGTYINNQRLAPHAPTPLNAGDRLRCGAWEAIVEAQ